MRILQVHNKYRPGWGGEDTVADLEADLLRRNGHEVERLSAWTGELEGASAFRLLAAGLGTVWSLGGYTKMKKAIASFSPDLVHVHNEFPLLSPSIFWASNRAGVPVVQTMHNFRFACTNAILLRDEKPCEDCVGRFPWPALRHRCYGSSLLRTAAVVSKNVLHRWLGTYRKKVDAYIVLSEFSREILLRAGLPRDRIFVKPNFTADLGRPVTLRLPRIVFAGWITHLKGLHLLLEAWSGLAPRTHQLIVAGDGPEREELQRRFGTSSNIVWLGSQSRDKVIELVASSRWLVQPSLAYENLSMSVLEAFSVGTPVIAPNHGGFVNMVSNEQEGLLFSGGDVRSLTTVLQAAIGTAEATWTQYSANAGHKFVRDYTERINYSKLMNIYEQATQRFQTTQGYSRRVRPSRVGRAIANSPRGES